MKFLFSRRGVMGAVGAWFVGLVSPAPRSLSGGGLRQAPSAVAGMGTPTFTPCDEWPPGTTLKTYDAEGRLVQVVTYGEPVVTRFAYDVATGKLTKNGGGGKDEG